MSEAIRGVLVSVAGWASASLLVNTVGPDTWTPSVDVSTLLEMMDELEVWLNNAARPWFGVRTWTLTTMLDRSPWLGFQLECSAACVYTPDADMRALLDWPAAGQTGTAIYTVTGIPSTCDCETDVGDWAQRVVGMGGISAAGSFMRDSQINSLRTPAVEALCDEGQTAALGEALFSASDPIWLQVARPVVSHTATPWVQIYPGAIPPPPSTSQGIYRVTIEAIG